MTTRLDRQRLASRIVTLVVAVSTAVTVLASAAAAAQTITPQTDEQAAILAVVDRFMHAVSANDAAAMSALRLEGGFTIVERPGPSGGTLVTRRVSAPSTGSSTGTRRERYWDPVVHVRGSLAVVWTPYEFWTNGKTSHCGIDVFDMIKEQGAWKIANMMWTVEPDACAALRPADSSRMRPSR
jgi:hypothetical protein